VFARRRQDILRVAYASELAGDLADMVRWCRGQRVPCQPANERELGDIAGSPHHEGVWMETRPRRWASAVDVAAHLVEKKGTAIALDRVRNPYNVGAILRTAAFFGVDAAILGAQAPHPALPPIAVRVAEGGAEHVTLSRTTDLADTLGRLRARGVCIVGADGHAPKSVFDFDFPRPAVLVFGHEREGLGERIRKHCDQVLAIPGSGAIESLNVGVAAGILVARLVQ
jgi:TrmH RNA methyltransferase